MRATHINTMEECPKEYKRQRMCAFGISPFLRSPAKEPEWRRHFRTYFVGRMHRVLAWLFRS